MIGGAFTVARPLTVQAGSNGTLTLGGNTANSSTFSGAVSLSNNLTVSQATSGTLSITTGGITAGSAGTKTVNFAGPVAITDSVVIGNGSGTVAVTNSGGTTTLSATNTYTGATSVTGGTLLVNGSLAAGSAVSVSNGATLGGGTTTTSGTAAGSISVTGTISPGQSYGSTGTGVLNTGSVTFNSGSSFDVDLNGTTETSGTYQYDQLSAGSSDTVALGSSAATLNVSLGSGFTPAAGSTFTIINCGSGGSLTGTFNGLANGASIQVGAYYFRITYSGTQAVLTTNQDTWTGAVSTDWNTAGNWSLGVVPTATMDAVVPNTTNHAVLDASVNPIHSLTISSGGVVDDSANNATFTVDGNWTNNGGTFTPGTGTVSFSGSAAQTIGGSTVTTFDNLTINNAAGVTNSVAGTTVSGCRHPDPDQRDLHPFQRLDAGRRGHDFPFWRQPFGRPDLWHVGERDLPRQHRPDHRPGNPHLRPAF